MERFIQFIKAKRTIALWLSLFLFLVTFGVVIDSGECLKTPKASRGIVSLELTFKTEKAQRLKHEWANTRCLDGKLVNEGNPVPSGRQASTVIDVAITNIWQDMLFIVGYVLFLAIIIIRKDKTLPPATSEKVTRVYVTLAMIAGLLDVVENVFMITFLKGDSIGPMMFAIPATFKFILIAVIIIFILYKYIVKISKFIEGFVAVLWSNRVSVVGLFIIYFALWKSDQGQDLLLNLNAHDLGPGLFYIVVTVIAALNWYLPKYYTDEFISKFPQHRGVRILFQNPEKEVPVKGDEANVPRVMATLTFIIPACAILNALDFMHIEYFFNFISPMVLLIATTLVYIWVIHEDFIDRFFASQQQKGRGWLVHVVMLSLVVIILSFGFFNKHAPYQLANLSIGLYLMSLFFLIATSLRTYGWLYQTLGMHAVLGWFKRQQANRWVIGVALLCILIFLTVNFIPVVFASWPYARFVTLPVVFTGIAFYTVFFFSLLILGKYSKVNWAALVILLGVIMAVLVDNKFHDLYRIDRPAQNKLEPVESYITNWVKNRKDEIASSEKPYPVFIVNTYGGGIRAAAWTSLVVSYLDSASQGKFQHHVFAYSGASGGTIGASVMCTLRKSQEGKPVNRTQVMDLYKNDFLTPVLVGLLGRDIFFSTTGWDAIDDRARLQDHVWETHLRSLDNGRYAEEFCSLWYDSAYGRYDIPLLFANTYHVESGLKGIMAPVKLSQRHFPEAVEVNAKLDSGIPLSTGAFLSARFPYISPAGKLDDAHHFLDGGLKENSGAETALELYTLFREQQELMKNDSILGKAFQNIKVYFVSLNNTGRNDPNGTTRNLVEFTAPVTALYNNWVGNTLKADAYLNAQMKGSYYQLRPMKDTIFHAGIPFRPVLPLGWQISDYALQRLNESLTYCNAEDKTYGSTPAKLNEILKLVDGPNIQYSCVGVKVNQAKRSSLR